MLYEEAEKFLSKQSEEWSTLIQEIGPCRLKISNELLPHQSIIQCALYGEFPYLAACFLKQIIKYEVNLSSSNSNFQSRATTILRR